MSLSSWSRLLDERHADMFYHALLLMPLWRDAVDLMVSTAHSWSIGRSFDSESFHSHVTTHTLLLLIIKQYNFVLATMLCRFNHAQGWIQGEVCWVRTNLPSHPQRQRWSEKKLMAFIRDKVNTIQTLYRAIHLIVQDTLGRPNLSAGWRQS